MSTPRLIPDTEMRGFMEALLDLGKFEQSGMAWFLTSVQVANCHAVRASEGQCTERSDPQHLLDGPVFIRPDVDLLAWARDIRKNTFDRRGEDWLISASRSRFESIIAAIPLYWFPAAQASGRSVA
jgi:hypothetical protein